MKVYGPSGNLDKLQKSHTLFSMKQIGFEYLAEAKKLLEDLLYILGKKIVTPDTIMFSVFDEADYDPVYQKASSYMSVRDFLQGTLKSLFSFQSKYFMIPTNLYTEEMPHIIIQTYNFIEFDRLKPFIEESIRLCNDINRKIALIYRELNHKHASEIIMKQIESR
jgi:hypothetical protein